MAVFVCADGFFNYYVTRTNLINNNLANLDLLAEIKTQEVGEFTRAAQLRAADLALDSAVRQYTSQIESGSNGENRSLLEKYLKQEIFVGNSVNRIDVVDAQGTIIASSDSALSGTKIEDFYIHEFQGLSGQEAAIYFSSELYRAEGMSPFFAAVMPIFSVTSSARMGVIVTRMDSVHLNNLLQLKANLEGVPEDVSSTIIFPSIYLIGSDGKIIVAPTQANIGMGENLANYIPVQKCTQKQSIVEGYKSFNDVNVFGASECLPNGWTLVAEIPQSDVLALLYEIEVASVLVGVFIWGAASLLALWLLERFLNPLENFEQVIHKIEKGDFSQRVKIYSQDEIGRVAIVFNKMAEGIQHANEEMDAALKVKTASLSQKLKEQEETQMALLNVAEDLEREKVTTQALADDLQKFRLAVENSSDQIVITDPDAKIIYANPTTVHITGYAPQEILGKTPALWGNKMGKEFYQEMWRIIKTERKHFTGEVNNRRKDGSSYTAELNIYPILDNEGVVRFFVGVERDITKAKEVEAAKNEFVSVAAHQLRTPVSAIKWNLEMFTDEGLGKMTPKQKQYLEYITSSNQRMINLVNALLSVSRIDLGKFAHENQPTDIAEFVRGEIKELNVELERKKIDLQALLPLSSEIIDLDRNFGHVILQNLLSNAIKYTPERGRVEVEARKEKKNLFLRVSDSGLGIPLDQRDRIFEKFFRAENAVKAVPEGTGLGLYIVKSLVEKSGGKIWFESKENEGTTFYVTLPLQGLSQKDSPQGS